MKSYVTNAGAAMLARALTEQLEIEFVRCDIGDGEFDKAGRNPREATGLVGYLASLGVAFVKREPGGCAVACDLNLVDGDIRDEYRDDSDGSPAGAATHIEDGTVVSELGVYARAGDGQPVLFAYCFESAPEVVLGGDGAYERRFVVHVAMSDDELDLTVTLNTIAEAVEDALARASPAEVRARLRGGRGESAADYFDVITDDQIAAPVEVRAAWHGGDVARGSFDNVPASVIARDDEVTDRFNER